MSSVVTYSPAYTLVPTYECFNRCSYCNFRQPPGHSPWLTLRDAQRRLAAVRDDGVIEILVLSGEVHPQSARRRAWVQHLEDLCQLALCMGYLPHTNAGPLGFEEMRQLAQVNVSMGLMLEQLTPTLGQTVHRHAPSKQPAVRLQQLTWAGELKIPFTTGLLLGIGETVADWQETLSAIATLHRRYGHIQEVILQPHQPGQTQIDPGDACDPQRLLAAVTLAKEILPATITVQIPPNLVGGEQMLIACLTAGARDLGGIGPRDEVNPDYPHPTTTALAPQLQAQGWQLVPRLPVYPAYDDWLPTPLKEAVQQFRKTLLNG